MPKKRPEDPPKGSPAWMATFSDLMNLLLCFFVLLFSMSTVDADKFQQVIASLQSSVSILPAGGTSIGEGEMISAGVRQLEFMDSYYNEIANSAAQDSEDQTDGKDSVQEAYEKEGLAESEKMAEEIDNNGELKFGESHIMCNLFTIDAIEKISKEPLIYHSAFKKNSYIDENGKEVIPTEPNSYKFEAFIFDSFELFDDIAILRGKREDDFAPVKNKEGVDSPKTAKELYEKYWERN